MITLNEIAKDWAKRLVDKKMRDRSYYKNDFDFEEGKKLVKKISLQRIREISRKKENPTQEDYDFYNQVEKEIKNIFKKN